MPGTRSQATCGTAPSPWPTAVSWRSAARATAPTAETWDPATKTWTLTSPMNELRESPSVARLRDGRVIAAGGEHDEAALASAEIYDPATDVWTPIAPMGEARQDAGISILPDGRVLVAGGYGWQLTGAAFPYALRSSEIYDPAAGTWSRTGDLGTAHGEGNAMVTLADGRSVMTGGFWYSDVRLVGSEWKWDDSGRFERSVELFDPATSTWTPAYSMGLGRAGHAAVALGDGTLLVAGGWGAGTPAERGRPMPLLPDTPDTAPLAVDPPAKPAPVLTGAATFLRPPSRGLRPNRNFTITVRLRCAAGAACHDQVVLRKRGSRAVLARRAFSAKAGHTVSVRLKLSKATRRKLRHRTTQVTLELKRAGIKLPATLRG